jgi:hypothetical protein
MYRKADFLKSLKQEAKIIKHLASVLTPAQLDYRPTAAQRSTLETLQYLSYAPLATTEYLVSGSWDHYDAMAAAAKEVTPATIAKVIDKQVAAITKRLAKLGDAQILRKTVKSWSGKKMGLGEALIELVLKTATAYRMQLFLFAKASGSAQLTSSDCWQGVAAKKKAEAQA